MCRSLHWLGRGARPRGGRPNAAGARTGNCRSHVSLARLGGQSEPRRVTAAHAAWQGRLCCTRSAGGAMSSVTDELLQRPFDVGREEKRQLLLAALNELDEHHLGHCELYARLRHSGAIGRPGKAEALEE